MELNSSFLNSSSSSTSNCTQIDETILHFDEKIWINLEFCSYLSASLPFGFPDPWLGIFEEINETISGKINLMLNMATKNQLVSKLTYYLTYFSNTHEIHLSSQSFNLRIHLPSLNKMKNVLFHYCVEQLSQ